MVKLQKYPSAVQVSNNFENHNNFINNVNNFISSKTYLNTNNVNNKKFLKYISAKS